MARFILDYDTTLDRGTKSIITENMTPSMVAPSGDSVQYCLDDLIDFMLDFMADNPYVSVDSEDMDTLHNLKGEGVNYIEICL
jgi:hypothetical protein